MNSPTAQNKRVFQLRQENNPEPKRNIKTPPMVIPIQLHKLNKHEQESQQSRQLQLQLQQHHSQQQRVVTSACLPPHQKVHAIQIFRSTTDEDNSHLAKATRLHSSMIDTSKSSNSSFLPPINPSSGSLKKKKKINFISNAVAALTNGSKGSPGIFSRSQSSSTPNSRNSSPMRRQASDISPGNRKSLEGKPCQLIESSRNSDFKRPSLFLKSSSNPALTEKHNRSSHPSPSPTRHKISSSSPSKKQLSKQSEDTTYKTMHPHRRMSLPLNKCSSQSRPQDLQTQQKSKQTCSNVDRQQPIVWQEGVQQRREPSIDSGLFLFAPASQNFIHSQRVLSRVKSATQGPSIGKSLNISDDEISEIFPISPATCCKKENIYEEIDLSSKNEASITITTSCYQSPSLSSSSSSSSFFLNGRADSHNGEQLDRMRLKQKSLDDGYSSQECQNLPLRRSLNQKNNPSVAIAAVPATNRLPNVLGIMTGSVEYSIKSEKLKLERHSSLDGKNSIWHKNQSGYQDVPLDVPGNESSSDECIVELKHIHSSDCNPLSHNHRIDDRTISNQNNFQSPNNVRLESRCGLLPPRKVQSRSKIGAYQTLPKVNNGMNSECYFMGRGFQQNSDIVCSHDAENELRRLRLLIWTERKNNEEREAEVERRWVARMEGVVAEARSIEQSLRSQLQQLRKQFVHLQDQLRKCQDVNKNRLSLFEASTQTPRSKEFPVSSSLINYKIQQGHHKEAMKDMNHSFSSSCSSIDSSDVNANESGVAMTTSSQPPDNITLKHLRTELENCKATMEEEQMRWMNEKNSVIEYQQRLQLNYIQAMKKNELLTEELHQLTAELEKFQHNDRQLGENK